MAFKPLSKKQYEERSRNLIDRIRAGATPFADRTFEAVQARRERAKHDDLFFIREYLPHWITAPNGSLTPFAKFHSTIALMCQLENQLGVVAGFRESAKSTIARAVALKQGVLGLRHFITYISFSQDNSIDILQPIKLEYEYNERIKGDFGDLVGRSDWSEDKFVTRTGTCYASYGRDDVVRSANYKGHRIDLAIMDDMEDPKKSMNIKQVEKYKDWIEQDVLFAINSPRWSAVFLGNLVQNPSIIYSLVTGEHTDHYRKHIIRALEANDKNTDEEKRIASECRKSGFADGEKSSWEERHPTIQLLTERQNNPRTFATERMQYPRDSATKKFRREWFRYATENQISGKIKTAVVWDPSTGKGKDYHAIVVMSVNDAMKFFVRWCWIRNNESKWTALGVWFDAAKRYNADMMICEGNAFQETIREDYYKYVEEKKIMPHGRLIIEPTRESKDLRIERLESPIENGFIYFIENAGDMSTLEYQVENYPNVNDDAPDAIERAYSKLKNVWRSIEDYQSMTKREAQFSEGAW